MIHELIYTSWPRGLKSGTSGFTSVAYTEGIPRKYIALCESLSAYKYLYPLDHPLYDMNPVMYGHHRFHINGQPLSILTKVVAAGRDYSGRENKFAHHIILNSHEMLRCGPAWAVMHGNLFMDQWYEEPRLLPRNRVRLPRVSALKEQFYARNWQAIFGDSKAAGAFAQAALDRPFTPSFILFDPEKIPSCLPLLVDAMVLVPPEKRWLITFNTYFFSKPMDSDCQWRCCIDDPQVRSSFGKYQDALRIDLSNQSMEGNVPANRELKGCAQNGNMPSWRTVEMESEKVDLPDLSSGLNGENGVKGEEGKTRREREDEKDISFQYMESESGSESMKSTAWAFSSPSSSTPIPGPGSEQVGEHPEGKKKSLSMPVLLILLCLISIPLIFVLHEHLQQRDENRNHIIGSGLDAGSDNTMGSVAMQGSESAMDSPAATVNNPGSEPDSPAAMTTDPGTAPDSPTATATNPGTVPDSPAAMTTDPETPAGSPTLTPPNKTRLHFYSSMDRINIGDDEEDLERIRCWIMKTDGTEILVNIEKPIVTDTPNWDMLPAGEKGEAMGYVSLKKFSLYNPDSYAAVYLNVPDRVYSDFIWINPVQIPLSMILYGAASPLDSQQADDAGRTVASRTIQLGGQSSRLFPFFLSLISPDGLKGGLQLKLSGSDNHPIVLPLVCSMGQTASAAMPSTIDVKLSDDLSDTFHRIRTSVLEQLTDIDGELEAVALQEGQKGVQKGRTEPGHDDLGQYRDDVDKYNTIDELINELHLIRERIDTTSLGKNRAEIRLRQIDQLLVLLKGVDDLMKKNRLDPDAIYSFQELIINYTHAGKDHTDLPDYADARKNRGQSREQAIVRGFTF